jgi:peptidoglycan/xylan/chitin deacetylase (PgdA/CDA1 family)
MPLSLKLTSALTLLLLIGTVPLKQPGLTWPGNKKAAIVLTYDDALRSQLDVAIPQLDKANLKGTFFLNGKMTEKEVARWRAASKEGHELGNHSIFHPCSSSILKTDAHYALESYTIETLLREISVMNNFLYAIDNKTAPRSYSYPCSESVVEGVDYADALKRSGLIRYARTGGDQRSVVTDFRKLDPYQVPSWGFLDKPDGATLIDFVKRVRQAEGMGVLQFHGVGGDYLEVSAQAHEQLLEYLRGHQDEIWVGTFHEVMDYVTAKR